MSAIDDFRAKIKNRKVVFGSTFSAINCIYLPGLFKDVGADFMLFDCEHGNIVPETAVDMIQMCRMVDLPSIVRVQDCEYHCISKCLDMGADGILIPRTENEDQVKLAIESMRFFPRGRKGGGGIGLLRPGENTRDFNNNRLLFLQIESPLGVSNLENLLNKYSDEIAGIIIGPGDMGITSGEDLLASRSPKVVELCRKTIEICKRYEKSVGMFLFPNQLREWVSEGMNILWCNTDFEFMKAGVKSCLESIKDLRE